VSDTPVKAAFDDLFTYLEQLETQTRAILDLLKQRNGLTDEELVPYLEQASKSAEIRLRAARARIDHLFTADEKAKPAAEAVSAPEQKQSGQPEAQSRSEKQDRKQVQNKPEPAAPPQEKQSEKPATSTSPPTKETESKSEPSEIVAGRDGRAA
jgi:hypothetical protein